MAERETLLKIHNGLKKYFEWNFIFLYTTNSERIQIIHESNNSILFDYITANGRHTYRYIRVTDVSTIKHAFLSVPYEINTCEQAIAWTFGMSPSEYSLSKET